MEGGNGANGTAYECSLSGTLLAVLGKAEEEPRSGLLARRSDDGEVICQAQREVGAKSWRQ